MSQPVRISLDAMGGDHGPSVVVPGAALALERHPTLRFLMFGNERTITPLVEADARLKGAVEIHHTEVAVSMDDKPSQAVRAGRGKSSMWRAVQAVRDGHADAAVSAGNTGALMAMSKICLKTMAHVERPAIAAIWPTTRGESIVLDVGASIGADAAHLVDMADHGRRHGAYRFRPRPPDRRPPQCRRRGDQGHRDRQGGGAHPQARPTCRISPITASSRATISARAPSTWW